MPTLELQHVNVFFGQDLIWPHLTRGQIDQIKSVAKLSDFTVVEGKQRLTSCGLQSGQPDLVP